MVLIRTFVATETQQNMSIKAENIKVLLVLTLFPG